MSTAAATTTGQRRSPSSPRRQPGTLMTKEDMAEPVIATGPCPVDVTGHRRAHRRTDSVAGRSTTPASSTAPRTSGPSPPATPPSLGSTRAATTPRASTATSTTPSTCAEPTASATPANTSTCSATPSSSTASQPAATPSAGRPTSSPSEPLAPRRPSASRAQARPTDEVGRRLRAYSGSKACETGRTRRTTLTADRREGVSRHLFAIPRPRSSGDRASVS